MKSSYNVVLITYNEEAYIKDTVESILNQSIKPYRIVVIDDGSTDATPQILDSLPVHVKRIRHHNNNGTVYSNTLSNVRNVGFAYIQNDPVDWVYVGDADTILPPRYCEMIMKHSDENGACMGCGSIDGIRIELPSDGFRMIKLDWLKSIGMETKWESIYLCVKALSTGNSILMRYADDCVVRMARPFGERWTPNRSYQQGRLVRRMGMPLHGLVFRCMRYMYHRKIRHACRFLIGGLSQRIEVSEDMVHVYEELYVKNILRKYIGGHDRRHRMFTKYGENVICHMPSDL